MSDKVCDIDISQLQKIFDGLDKEARHKILMSGLKQGGKTLQELTRQTLLRKMPQAADKSNGRFKNKAMVEGIGQVVDEAQTAVIVSIMRDPRNIWFEDGTDQRKLLRGGAKDYVRGYKNGTTLHRKEGSMTKYPAGANRGRVEGKHFFAEARQSEDTQRAVIQRMTEEFDKAISKSI